MTCRPPSARGCRPRHRTARSRLSATLRCSGGRARRQRACSSGPPSQRRKPAATGQPRTTAVSHCADEVAPKHEGGRSAEKRSTSSPNSIALPPAASPLRYEQFRPVLVSPLPPAKAARAARQLSWTVESPLLGPPSPSCLNSQACPCPECPPPPCLPTNCDRREQSHDGPLRRATAEEPGSFGADAGAADVAQLRGGCKRTRKRMSRRTM